MTKTTKEMARQFERGAWFAWDEVLSWINTQEERLIDKNTLYKHVMQLRPTALVRHYYAANSIDVKE